MSALIATKFERLDFASVSAPIDASHDPAQSGLTRPDLETLGTLIPKPTKMVVMRFGVAAYQDLRAEKFAGSAIKPLRTASFAAVPESSPARSPRTEAGAELPAGVRPARPLRSPAHARRARKPVEARH